jgi:hypothetical protein
MLCYVMLYAHNLVIIVKYVQQVQFAKFKSVRTVSSPLFSSFCCTVYIKNVDICQSFALNTRGALTCQSLAVSSRTARFKIKKFYMALALR